MAVASFVSLLVIALSVSLDGLSVGMLYGARGIRIPAVSLLIVSGCSGLLLFVAMLLGDWLALRLTPKAAISAGAAILVAVGLWAIIQFFRNQKAERTTGQRSDQRSDQRSKPQPIQQSDQRSYPQSRRSHEQTDQSTRQQTEHQSHLKSHAQIDQPIHQQNDQQSYLPSHEQTGTWTDRQTERKTDQQAGQPAPIPESERAKPHRAAERMLFRLELRKLGVVVQILRTPSAADMDRSGNISAAEAALLGVALSLDAIGAGIGAALVGYGAVSTALSIAAASGLFVRLGTLLGRRVAGRLGRRLAVLPGFLLIGVGILKLLQL